jgi:hypothetical protein
VSFLRKAADALVEPADAGAATSLLERTRRVRQDGGAPLPPGPGTGGSLARRATRARSPAEGSSSQPEFRSITQAELDLIAAVKDRNEATRRVEYLDIPSRPAAKVPKRWADVGKTKPQPRTAMLGQNELLALLSAPTVQADLSPVIAAVPTETQPAATEELLAELRGSIAAGLEGPFAVAHLVEALVPRLPGAAIVAFAADVQSGDLTMMADRAAAAPSPS